MPAQDQCREAVIITRDFPIAIKFAEVDVKEECPTPVIGDVMAGLKREIAARCAQGDCESGSCVPESPDTVAIHRQLGQFSRIVDDRRECWVVIEAEVETRCICEGDG